MAVTLSDSSAVDLYRRLEQYAPKSRSVVDVGCGRGTHLAGGDGAAALADVRRRGGDVLGIDVAVPATGNPHVTELREISAGRWPVASESIDLAFCDWVLEHVTDPDLFFVECARVLRPGGHFIARTMQTWSVAGIGARLVPSRFHTPMIQKLQPGMNADDLFPTALKCNTVAALRRLTAANGLRLDDTTRHPTLHGYGLGRARVEAALHSLESRLPAGMHHAIVVTISKPVI